MKTVEESLFTFEELNEKSSEEPMKDIHVDQMLKKVAKLEREIEELETLKADSAEFYNRRIASIKAKIDVRAEAMQTYMIAMNDKLGKKTIKVPSGTLRYVSRKKPIWCDDDELINFSKENNIPVKINEKPDKISILEYIKNCGDYPNGFEIQEVSSFTFKTNNDEG